MIPFHAKYLQRQGMSLMHIIYSNVPDENLLPNGRSRNYVIGKLEVGVSVYPVLLLERLFSMTTMASGTLIGGMPCTPYMAGGEYVANGSDGEPLLRNVRNIAIVSYDREKKGSLSSGN
jgi:hypothetical protein